MIPFNDTKNIIRLLVTIVSVFAIGVTLMVVTQDTKVSEYHYNAYHDQLVECTSIKIYSRSNNNLILLWDIKEQHTLRIFTNQLSVNSKNAEQVEIATDLRIELYKNDEQLGTLVMSKSDSSYLSFINEGYGTGITLNSSLATVLNEINSR